MSDPKIGVLFDNNPGISFVQGEDRSILLTVSNLDQNTPLDLTGGHLAVNFPLQGGGTVKRASAPIVVTSAQVSVAVSPGNISVPDHGLVTGDAVTLAVVSGALPAPLAPATNYLVYVVDVDDFYLTDTSGNPIVLTNTGSGSFTVTNPTDVVITNPTLGQATLALRAPITSVINAGLAQNFQVSIIDASGHTRIVLPPSTLDVYSQPDP